MPVYSLPPPPTSQMTVKASDGKTFGWNSTQLQSITVSYTVQKKCNVIAASLIDFASGGELTDVSGYIYLNGADAPGRLNTIYYGNARICMFPADSGDIITVYSKAKTTKSYGTVAGVILTDE